MAEQISEGRPFKDKVREFLSRKKSGMTSVNKCSDELYEYNCDPCKSFEEYNDAEGFCTVCNEYLCSTCLRSHKRNKLSKHHALLAKDNMPKKSPKLCYPCKIAGDEKLSVGYCTVCTDFLCHDCFKSHPRNEISRSHVLVEQEQIEDTERAASSHNINTAQFEDSGETITEEYIHVRDINVQSDTDKEDCYISSMTPISINGLVISDNSNKCIKYFNIKDNLHVLTDVLTLPSSPFGISALSNDKIAVALPSRHKIKIISVNGRRLIVGRKIKTNGKCLDVKMVNTRLYVSFFLPVKFQILKQTGTLIKTIKPDKEVLKLCTYPRHIAVTPDESKIYVSDRETNAVISLDMNGKMLALYQSDLNMPYGIIIFPSGSVYICNRKQDNVFKMNSDLSEPKVIIGRGDGLERPKAICLNTLNQHRYIYISSGRDEAEYANMLKVFEHKEI